MTAHIIILTFVGWGHMRPECNFAVNLARKYPDLTISLIADADLQGKAQAEVNCGAGELGTELAQRIRVIAAGRSLAGLTPQLLLESAALNPKEFHFPLPAASEAILRICEKVMEDKEVTDDNGLSWPAVGQKPSLVIADMFMTDASVPLKKKYGIKTYFFWVGHPAGFTRLHAPLAHGGQAEGYVAECDAIEADPKRANGRSYAEIAKQVWAHSGRYPDDVVRVKGFEPYYEWEDYPQEFWQPGMFWSIAGTSELVEASDGLVVPMVHDIAPDGYEGIKEWYSAERSRPVLFVGPQLMPSYMDYERTGFPNTASVVGTEVGASFKGLGDNTSEGDKTCLAFLDKALTQRGPDSALYMSFGTLMYPDLEHIRYLLEVLMSLEEPIPFIFATAGMRPIVSDEMAKKVNESGRGLIVPWAPQQAIFLHPATGWALSHCGAGAMYESLCQSVPLIAWPIAVDQPQHARWMSETLDTAFELLQVRVGLGQKKAFRGGPEGTEIVGTEEAIKAEIRDVLKRCKSEEGHRKRANAKRVKQQIKEARTAGGQIDQHYELLRQAIVV